MKVLNPKVLLRQIKNSPIYIKYNQNLQISAKVDEFFHFSRLKINTESKETIFKSLKLLSLQLITVVSEYDCCLFEEKLKQVSLAFKENVTELKTSIYTKFVDYFFTANCPKKNIDELFQNLKNRTWELLNQRRSLGFKKFI